MKMIIGGKAVGAADGKTIEVRNPATGAVIDTIPAATPADIETAVAEAVAALASLGYTQGEIMPVLKKIPDCGALPSEEIIRKALKLFFDHVF